MRAGDKVEVLSKPNGIKMFEGVAVDDNSINVTLAYRGAAIQPGDTMTVSDNYTFKVVESKEEEKPNESETDVDRRSFKGKRRY